MDGARRRREARRHQARLAPPASGRQASRLEEEAAGAGAVDVQRSSHQRAHPHRGDTPAAAAASAAAAAATPAAAASLGLLACGCRRRRRRRLHPHPGLRVPAAAGQQRVYRRRGLLRHQRQHIARLVGDAGAAQVEFQQAHVLEVGGRGDAAVGGQARPVRAVRAVPAAAAAAARPVRRGWPRCGAAAGGLLLLLLLLPSSMLLLLLLQAHPAGRRLHHIKLAGRSQRFPVCGAAGCGGAVPAGPGSGICGGRRRRRLLARQPGYPVLADELGGGVPQRRLRGAGRQREAGTQRGPQQLQPGIQRRLIPAAMLVVAQAQLQAMGGRRDEGRGATGKLRRRRWIADVHAGAAPAGVRTGARIPVACMHQSRPAAHRQQHGGAQRLQSAVQLLGHHIVLGIPGGEERRQEGLAGGETVWSLRRISVPDARPAAEPLTPSRPAQTPPPECRPATPAAGSCAAGTSTAGACCWAGLPGPWWRPQTRGRAPRAAAPHGAGRRRRAAHARHSTGAAPPAQCAPPHPAQHVGVGPGDTKQDGSSCQGAGTAT